MWKLIKIVLPKVEAEWEYLAYAMEYHINTVQTIKKDCQTSGDCCKKLFEDWLTTSRGVQPTTWDKLLERIKEVDSLKTATEAIKEELKSAFA